MSDNIKMSEVIRRGIDSRLGDVWTCFPGRIQTYDASKQVANVEAMIRRPVPTVGGGIKYEELPVLPNVPIAFPRKGTQYAITWPLEPGDYLWVHVTTYSFTNWRRTGELSDAGDIRAQHLANCYAVPGAAPNAQALDQASMPALVLEGPAIVLGKNAADFVALAALVKANFDLLYSAISGAVPTPMDGGAALKAAILATLGSGFPDVKASKVKAE